MPFSISTPVLRDRQQPNRLAHNNAVILKALSYEKKNESKNLPSSLGSNSASSSALVGSRSVSAEFCCCPASLPLTSPCFIVVPLRTWWPRNAAWILVAAASTVRLKEEKKMRWKLVFRPAFFYFFIMGTQIVAWSRSR